MFKKLVASLMLAGTLISLAGVNAFANSPSTSFSASFGSGSGAVSYLSGASNGKFFSLTPGRASLDVTTMNGKGAVDISIRLYRTFSSDMVIDTKTVEWNGHYTYSGVPETSSKYYLFFQCTPYISQANTQYTIAGMVNDAP